MDVDEITTAYEKSGIDRRTKLETIHRFKVLEQFEIARRAIFTIIKHGGPDGPLYHQLFRIKHNDLPRLEFIYKQAFEEFEKKLKAKQQKPKSKKLDL